MKLLAFTILLFSTFSISAQQLPVEKVDWRNAKTLSAKDIEIKTSEMELECKDCKVFEIATKSGVTGIYMAGKGKMKINGRKISDNFSGCMVRFHPKDYASLVQYRGKQTLKDEGFNTATTKILQSLFRHCYHQGMNAIIPPQGTYAANFLAENYGDLLASFSPEEHLVYSFSEKKELFHSKKN